MIAVDVLQINRNLLPNEYSRLLEVISADKREQIKQFSRFEDAQRTLLGDVLIRRALKDKCGISNRAIVFGSNIYGKPFLTSNPKYHFNISHSKKYVVGAIGCSPVGIDVETIGSMDISITDRFFTRQEKRYISDFPNTEQLRAFYRIWTRKEAYIKREGRGFQIPLGLIDVLSPIDNTCFHLIFENKEALCHVCSCESISPTIEHHTMNSFLDKATGDQM